MVVASDIVFGQWQPAMLSGLKEKLDLHCFERKDNSPVFGTVNDPGGEEGSNIAVDSFYVAAGAPGGFANGHRAGAAKSLEQFPAFLSKHPPKQLGR